MNKHLNELKENANKQLNRIRNIMQHMKGDSIERNSEKTSN
jgi:hypothetical protein